MLKDNNFRNISKPRHGIIQVTVIHTLSTIILEEYTILNIHLEIIQSKNFSTFYEGIFINMQNFCEYFSSEYGRMWKKQLCPWLPYL